MTKSQFDHLQRIEAASGSVRILESARVREIRWSRAALAKLERLGYVCSVRGTGPRTIRITDAGRAALDKAKGPGPVVAALERRGLVAVEGGAPQRRISLTAAGARTVREAS